MANPVDSFEYTFGLTKLDAVVGDIIWAQIRFANGAFTMAVRDKTRGTQVKTTQVVPKIARVVALWEVSSVFTDCRTKCRELPLAKFSPITFSSVQATVGGKRVAVGGASVIEVVEDATKKGVKRMVVSRIGASGRSFTVTWKHN
jgi:hypothetical protein